MNFSVRCSYALSFSLNQASRFKILRIIVNLGLESFKFLTETIVNHTCYPEGNICSRYCEWLLVEGGLLGNLTMSVGLVHFLLLTEHFFGSASDICFPENLMDLSFEYRIICYFVLLYSEPNSMRIPPSSSLKFAEFDLSTAVGPFYLQNFDGYSLIR